VLANFGIGTLGRVPAYGRTVPGSADFEGSKEHVQATLLGVSIAVILALVAALVGPHFVDWSAHRAVFEAQAEKLVGAPVRIAGPIDVRLLPTPMLTLRQIALKRASDSELTARELHVELALGALVRGELHAAEVRLVGAEFELRLGPDGRLERLGARLAVNPDQLWIQRFALEDARATLSDAASGARLAIERLWFTGELRSLLGPIKGEGGFMVAGDRYAYRLSASRVGDDGAVRLRLGVDPTDAPLAIEADGALRFDADAPRFEGLLTLARPVVAGAAAPRPGAMTVPWRLTSRVKATPARALLENVEYQYGPDERAARLGGTAEIVFGKSPRAEGLLSARQLDLDRVLALPDRARRQPLAALKALVEPFGGAYRPPLPVRLGLSVDTVTLAGGTLQGVRGDVRTEGEGWSIETFELRAPGSAQIRVSGRMAVAPAGVTFKGPFQVEANDARALVAWFEGRADGPQAQLGALKAAGDLTIGAHEVAVESTSIAGASKAGWPTHLRRASRRASMPPSRRPTSTSMPGSRSRVPHSTVRRSSARTRSRLPWTSIARRWPASTSRA
jgi:AsmA-like protein